MEKPVIFTTPSDRDDAAHRRSGRHSCSLLSAARCLSAMAFLVVLLGTLNEARAFCPVGETCVPIPLPPPPPPPPPDVLTQHNNNSRWGAQPRETILKPSNVGPNSFGKLYERHVDGQIIAQPLYVGNLSIPNKGPRNVVYVATRENKVYAFDADDMNADPNAPPLWSTKMPVEPADQVQVTCSETVGPPGITSTPVIDRAAGTMYLVARNANGTIWLHVLDIATGADKGHQQINMDKNVSYNGVNFNEGLELSRAGLLLVNGVIIIGFSALNCDGGNYHGWVLAYSASNLQYRSAFATTNSSRDGGGVWASGKGIVADTLGNIYFETGNCRQYSGAASDTDLCESFVKLTVGPPPSYQLTYRGRYTVNNQVALDIGDTDLGSSGPLLLPGNRLVGGGKQGKLYVLDPGTMKPTQNPPAGPVAGGSDGFQAFRNTWHEDSNQPECMDPHTVLGTRCYMPDYRYEEDEHSGPNIHSGVIYWNGRLYGMAEKDYLLAFKYNPSTGTLDPSRTVRSNVRAPDGMPGAAISLSANGSSDGIIWASIPRYDGQTQNVPGALVAFRATPLDGTTTLDELWRDDDNIGFAKFNPPTIAGGKVFRPTFADKLIVYGLKSSATASGCYTIEQVYQNFTGPNGLLGNSIGSRMTAPDGAGLYQDYEGGAIAFTPPCAHEVHGAIYQWRGTAKRDGGIFAKWNEIIQAARSPVVGPVASISLASAGGSGTVTSFASAVASGKATGPGSGGSWLGFLGYPTTDETVTPDGIGRYNHFQNGSIYWSPTTGAHEVRGAIREEWAARGWEKSTLGYPVSDETDEIDGSGRVSLFEHGAIHWNRATGAISVSPNDPSMLLGPQQARAYRRLDIPGANVVALPQANPTMCQAKCAGNNECLAWLYEAPTTTQPPRCWIKNDIPVIESDNPCCTSGIKVKVQPANMMPMQGNRDQPGSTIFYTFPLPVKDPRLCQGECSENGTCRAWSYHVATQELTQDEKIIPHWCWLKSNKVTPVQDQCCSSGVKK
jgi:hypothetical protein